MLAHREVHGPWEPSSMNFQRVKQKQSGTMAFAGLFEGHPGGAAYNPGRL